MIPAIGFMIGAYIITRMVQNLSNKENNTVVALCSVVTIIIALFSIADLFLSGSNIASQIPR